MPSIISSAFSLGERCATPLLKDWGVDRQSILELIARGASGFHRACEPLMDVACRTANIAIEKSGISPLKVDALLFGSNSLKAQYFERDFSQELLIRLGLKNAYAQLVGFQNCGDSIPLLKTASAMIKAEEAENILIVIADDVEASNIPRILMNSYVHSDGASAAMVSSDNRGLQLKSGLIRHLDFLPDDSFDPNDLGSKLRYLLDAAVGMSQSLFDQYDYPQFIISHNMNRFFNREVAQAFNLGIDDIFGDYELGHCLASDILINIDNMMNKGFSQKKSDGLIFAPNSRSVGVYRVGFVSGQNELLK